nr:LysR family transcriptional regulator [Candidatus Pantoea persica]
MVLAGGGVDVVDLFTACRYADQLKLLPVTQPLPFEVMLISQRDRPQSAVHVTPEIATRTACCARRGVTGATAGLSATVRPRRCRASTTPRRVSSARLKPCA